jgi:ABC-2 type transport system ATP-binding protein
MTVGPMLDVQDLSKDFGQFHALTAVSFAVRSGEFVGLLGPNGAGKSTTLHMLLGFILPTSGTIRIFGLDPLAQREAVLSRVNFVSPYVGFPARLTVFENLSVYARLYGLRGYRPGVLRLLEHFGIDDCRDVPFARHSSGEAARVALCKAFLNQPEFLILDEPLASLDPHAALQTIERLCSLQQQQGTAVLYTSHNMAQIEAVCNRVIFLDRGCVIADGSPIEVTRRMVDPARATPALREVFLSLGGRRARESA